MPARAPFSMVQNSPHAMRLCTSAINNRMFANLRFIFPTVNWVAGGIPRKVYTGRFEFLGCLPAKLQGIQIGRLRIRQLLPPRLDGEVFLRLGDFGNSRVAVLRDQVTGEPGKLVIVHFLHRSLAAHDRFAPRAK